MNLDNSYNDLITGVKFAKLMTVLSGTRDIIKLAFVEKINKVELEILIQFLLQRSFNKYLANNNLVSDFWSYINKSIIKENGKHYFDRFSKKREKRFKRYYTLFNDCMSSSTSSDRTASGKELDEIMKQFALDRLYLFTSSKIGKGWDTEFQQLSQSTFFSNCRAAVSMHLYAIKECEKYY